MTVSILISEMPFFRAHVIGTEFDRKQTLFYVYERTKIPKVFKNSNTFIQEPIGKK